MLIDAVAYSFMQSIQNPLFTVISKFISFAFDPLTLILISFILATYLYVKFSKKRGIFFALIIFLTGVLIKLSKEIFQRARPLNPIIQESGFSMPSGHAAIALVFFGILSFLFSRRKSPTIQFTTTILAILIILLTSFSRVYLRVHWLTDVLGGLLLGAGILALGIWYVKKENL